MKKILSLILVFMLMFSVSACSSTQSDTTSTNNSSFKVGETWVVDGQWELTITNVKETQDRNQYSDKNPGAVYIVTYDYTNIGYEREDWDGLFISLDDIIIDTNGVLGYEYPGDVSGYAQETPVGATCRGAQICIGVETPGNFKIQVNEYDSNWNEQMAIFEIEI